MIETVLYMLLIIILIVGIVTYALRIWDKHRLEKALDVVDAWLESYRNRLTGFNRFTISKYLVQEGLDGEYDDVIDGVWKEMIVRKWIVLDSIDGEWIVKPNHPDQEVKPLNLFTSNGS